MLFPCAPSQKTTASHLLQGSPLARADLADMQQSEEHELPRGEHAVAKGPAEQPVLFSIIKYPRCQSLHCFKTLNGCALSCEAAREARYERRRREHFGAGNARNCCSSLGFGLRRKIKGGRSSASRVYVHYDAQVSKWTYSVPSKFAQALGVEQIQTLKP